MLPSGAVAAARILSGLLVACAAAAVAASAHAAAKPQIVFPVIGKTTYSDDFGDPRGQGRHEGIDILAAKRSLAVAAEGGTVKFWTTSASAGCMLYLYGDSGTTYLYVHLNDDLTAANDNRGTCVAGTAYAAGLVDGARVEAGQPVGFVGDSGDANGLHAHLHFEVHPKDGGAVDPYAYLRKARPLLFWEPDATRFTLVLDGTVVAATPDRLTLKVSLLREWPSHQKVSALPRPLTLAVPATSQLSRAVASASTTPADAPQPGERVRIWTGPLLADDATRAGADGALSAARILVR